MFFRLHMLLRRLAQCGLPFRVAVFAWSPWRKLVYRGLALAIATAIFFVGLALTPTASEAKTSAATAAANAAFAVTKRAILSDGMDLIRLGISNNMCALTFDDGPGPYTAQLLDTLAEHKVPATFFVIGPQVRRRPELIKRMLAEGHEVGNHSYSHTALRNRSPKAQQDDLLKMDHLLRELGAKPRFVRPPFGFYDHNTINVVKEMDGHIVMWTADSEDWRNSENASDILANMQMIYRGAPMRGVFLFHDTHRPTVDHMNEILDTLTAAGCRFVTLSEYIDTPKGGKATPLPMEAENAQPQPPVNFALEGRLNSQPETAPGVAENPPLAATIGQRAAVAASGSTVTAPVAENAAVGHTESATPLSNPVAVTNANAAPGADAVTESTMSGDSSQNSPENSSTQNMPQRGLQNSEQGKPVQAAVRSLAAPAPVQGEKSQGVVQNTAPQALQKNPLAATQNTTATKNKDYAAQGSAQDTTANQAQGKPTPQNFWSKPQATRGENENAARNKNAQAPEREGRFNPTQAKPPLTISTQPSPIAEPDANAAATPPEELLPPLTSPPDPPVIIAPPLPGESDAPPPPTNSS